MVVVVMVIKYDSNNDTDDYEDNDDVLSSSSLLCVFYSGISSDVKDNRWVIRNREWQRKDGRSVRKPKRRWRDDIVGQQGAVWTRIAKDRERWGTLAEGYFLQWKDTA